MSLRSKRGYALPLVLAVVALLAIVFASAAAAMTALAHSARAASDEAAFQKQALSAEARTLFFLSTSRFAFDGVSLGPAPPAGTPPRPADVKLDGRPYSQGEGAPPGLVLSLQDEAGLVNLDASRPDTLLRLFARLGLTAVEAETLRDRLLDAIDADDARRPRGAEAADYIARGLPPPRPGGFSGLPEANAVMDWPALISGARQRALERWATANPGEAAFNPYTASPEVLAIVLNLRSDQVAQIMATRASGAAAAMAQASGGIEGLATVAASHPNGRIAFAVRDLTRGLQYRSRLTPTDDPAGPPWRTFAAVQNRLKRLAARPDPAESLARDASLLPDPTGSPPRR